MNFKDAIISGFKNYINFKGRASRSEYWYWVLFCLVGGFAAGFLEGMVMGANHIEGKVHPISGLFNLVTLIPSFAVGVRRLHDIDRSGWWMLLFVVGGILLGMSKAAPPMGTLFALLGLAALIWLLYWYTKRGTMGDNRFGADPLFK